MPQVEYIVPEGYPLLEVSLDDSISDMCAQLKNVEGKGAPIPNSALAVQLTLLPEGAALEIMKRDQTVFVNFFCSEIMNSASMFSMLKDFYKTHDLGTPKRPQVSSWIHSVPISYDLLRENEVILCQQVTLYFFWLSYVKVLKKSNPMN